MKLRLGALCLFENPTGEAGRALIRQFVLVREADRMGYDDIWLEERHGDAARPSAAITTLLGHLAGVTSKARIGAVLQPLQRELGQLAEDLATAELLARGRLALAVDARGRAPADARDGCAALDALAELRTRLAAGVVVPQPSGAALPAWAVVDGAPAVRRAARQGMAPWLPAELPLAEVAPLLAQWREAGGDGTLPAPLLVRYACPAATREAALALAAPFAQALVGDASAPALLEEALVGSHAEVAARIRALADRFGLGGVVIAPMSAGFDDAKHILADMVDEVRPLLDD